MNRIFIYYILCLLIALITLSSCSHGWKTYTIKSGKHSSGDLGRMLLNTDRIAFDFKADSSWYYPSSMPSGWNKIRGLSHGHHQNNSSARIGYQCLKDTLLVIGAYCYVDGVSPQQNQTQQKGIIDTIQPGKVYHCVIQRKNDLYIIDFEGRRWQGPAGKDLKWGYLLNPYIGGEFTLKSDWHIDIKDL